MNKLVSKNPIQRFKQGKVIKAQKGTTFNAPKPKPIFGTIFDTIGDSFKKENRKFSTKSKSNKKPILSNNSNILNRTLGLIARTNNIANSGIRPRTSISESQQTPYPNGYYANKKSTTVTVKKPKTKSIRKKTTSVVEPAKPTVPVETTIPQEQRVASIVPNIPTPPTQITVERTPVTYDRAQTRDIMRTMGYNPYAFTGAQRKQLRQYLNGESNDTSLLSDIDLSRFKNNNTQSPETPSIATPTFVPSNKPLIFNGGLWKGQISDILGLSYAKQGGKLIPRNPVKQFKQK